MKLSISPVISCLIHPWPKAKFHQLPGTINPGESKNQEATQLLIQSKHNQYEA
jgi:hypothetical protein